MKEEDLSQTVEEVELHKKGIAGSTLKIIAIITMCIDHIGAIVLERMLHIYILTRFIGRIAFPIFCFLPPNISIQWGARK